MSITDIGALMDKAAPVIPTPGSIGLHTPWGVPDTVERLDEGIYSVSTPSHGGIWLSPERRAEFTADELAGTFRQQGERGWFEEDCDWALVALKFPKCFSLDNWFKAEKIVQARHRALGMAA